LIAVRVQGSGFRNKRNLKEITHYSTVTLFARFLGLSISVPRACAV
jgi:hypothetical protein